MSVQLVTTVCNVYMYGYGNIDQHVQKFIDTIRQRLHESRALDTHVVISDQGYANIISTWQDRQQCELCATQLQLEFTNIECSVRSEHENTN